MSAPLLFLSIQTNSSTTALAVGLGEGIAYLKVGEKARLIIPAELGYGSRAMGPIPANATLVFDVELVDVK